MNEISSYPKWQQKVVKTAKPVSDWQLYFRVLIFGMTVFGLSYFYTWSQKIPNVLNKSAADTAIILMGFSMLLSSICYFWNFMDTKIIYRKHLGLIGFAFALAHIALSFSALQRLFLALTWQNNAYWPALTGLLATIIFSIMALISNRYAATQLGGIVWRGILRTGYIAVLFVLAHVILLKYGRWLTWYNSGMKTLPSLSLLVSIFMVWVILMRILLWWSLLKKRV